MFDPHARRSRRAWIAAAVLWAVLAGLVTWLFAPQQREVSAEAGVHEAVEAPPEGALHVLFVGNSYTFVNDLPGTFAELARAVGIPVAVEMVAAGGQSFEHHAKDPQTRRRIEAREWDFVVLQEQSQRPGFDEAQVAREVIPAARALDARIHARSPRATTVLYQTWARKDGDSANCAPVPRTCTHAGQHARIAATYADLGRKLGARVAPVGTAWETMLREHGEVKLYQADGSHPTGAGTFLAACVLVETILGKSPVGAPARASLRLGEGEAGTIERVAEETARASPP